MNLDKNNLLLGGTSVAAVIMMVFGSVLNNQIGKGAMWALGFAGIALVLGIVVSKVMERRSASNRGDAMGQEMERVTRKGAGETGGDSDQDPSDVGLKVSDGIAKLREDGYNLGSFPFYLIIGEPKGGKTVACKSLLDQVGPIAPGMNNRYAGEGGTMNLDFFFLQESVIIDTAGRLTFEDTPELLELLDSLRRGRPDKPISGVMICVPADKLLLESAEAELIREADASRLSQALKTIQNRLGVRFPVYVIVTKSDLIPGFREYFSGIGTKGQAQIVGWSRAPGEGVQASGRRESANDVLDRPYSRDEMERGLRGVVRNVEEQHLSLLADPKFKNKKDASLFPTSFADATQQLVEMVDQVFQAQVRRTMRPFLRGVYFTSCKQTQPMLKGLAERLGIPLSQLQAGLAGKPQEGTVAFFLKNLFQNRILKECDLVTSVDNLTRARRKGYVQMGIWAAAAVVMFLTLLIGGASSLKQSVHQEAPIFRAFNDRIMSGDLLIPLRPGQVADDMTETVARKTPIELSAVMMDRITLGNPVPWLYWPVSRLTGKVEGRERAFRHCLAAGIIDPLITRNISKLKDPSQMEPDEFADRWIALLELREQPLGSPISTASASSAGPAFESTFRATLGTALEKILRAEGKGKEDLIARFQQTLDPYLKAELKDAEGRAFWLRYAQRLVSRSAPVLADAFTRYSEHLNGGLRQSKSSEVLEQALKLGTNYVAAEKKLGLDGNLTKLKFVELKAAVENLEGASFVRTFTNETAMDFKKAGVGFRTLMDRLGEVDPGLCQRVYSNYLGQVNLQIANLANSPLKRLEMEMEQLDQRLLGRQEGDDRAAFVRRYLCYEKASSEDSTLFDKIEAQEGSFEAVVADQRKAPAWDETEGGVHLGPDDGNIVKANAPALRKRALDISITNSWEAFAMAVRGAIQGDATQESREALRDYKKVLQKPFTGGSVDRALKGLELQRKQLAQEVDKGIDAWSTRYTQRARARLLENLAFPLVPSVNGGATMAKGDIEEKRKVADEVLKDLGSQDRAEDVRALASAVVRVAKALEESRVHVKLDTDRRELAAFQSYRLLPSGGGRSNYTVTRPASVVCPLPPSASLEIHCFLGSKTDAKADGQNVAKIGAFGVLRLLPRREPGGELPEAFPIVVQLEGGGRNTIPLEVILTGDNAFPLKDWFELGAALARN